MLVAERGAGKAVVIAHGRPCDQKISTASVTRELVRFGSPGDPRAETHLEGPGVGDLLVLGRDPSGQSVSPGKPFWAMFIRVRPITRR
jgi:hypothetical protein